MTGTLPKRSRVPRRAPRACKQCRTAKVRCSGTHPCARCQRRKDSCIFPVDDPKVSVSERYLLQIEQEIANAATNAAKSVSPTTPCNVSSTLSDEGVGLQHVDLTSDMGCPSFPTWPRSESGHSSHTRAQDEQGQKAQSVDNEPSLIGLHIPDSHPPTQAETDRSDKIFSCNPLVRDVTYLKDPAGRYRFMGPTSTWSFFRRLVALIEQKVPQPPESPSDPFNTDGTAFRLRWNPLPYDQTPDIDQLPPVDYSIYLFHTVKFRLGLYVHIIDEQSFLSTLNRFETSPQDTVRNHRLWFVEYLLVLAFGESFTANTGPTMAPAGSLFAARAMAAMPDFAQLHDEGLLAIEVLALAALYFHSIDMRVSAYQYIGQALRLSYVEGIHRELPDQLFGEQLARRCKRLWWGVYVLDRQLSAQMGTPSSIRDEDTTTSLPWKDDGSTMAICLTLSIKLSRLLATITSTVYTVNDKLGSSFAHNTKTAIKGLAEVAQEGDRIMNSRNQSTTPSRVMSSINLMYYHCITQATKPLMMCLMKEFIGLPKPDLDRDMITQPISALLKTAVSSALTTLKILASLEKQRLLDSFLPFDLECAFSSVVSLCIMHVVLPEYVTEDNWAITADNLFVSMMNNGSVVAGLRRHELYYLKQLLNLVTSSNSDIETSSMMVVVDVSQSGVPDMEQQRHIGTAWDHTIDFEAMNMDPDPLFDLALKFGIQPEIDVIGRLGG